MTTTSQLDYMTVLLKCGWDAEPALALNNLWLACGLTSVVIEKRRFALRQMVDV